MKIQLKYLVLFTGLLVFNCKDENKTEALKEATKTEIKNEVVKQLSEVEKTEIVRYYLINGRKLPEKDFHKFIFGKYDGVKIINYEGRDAYFSIKFSEALKFYNTNKK